MSFGKIELSGPLISYLEEAGIKTPSEVQAHVIPKLLDNKSLMVVAQTGSGKTLAYALPMVERLKALEVSEGMYQKKGMPQGLIIAPTKELAMQIQDVFKGIAHHAKIRVRMAIGGMTQNELSRLATQTFDILVATPSRAAAALKKLSLDELKFLVFDESDTLFEMGFKKDIESILRHVEYDNCNISFFSATLPTSVELFLAEKFRKKNLEKVMLSDSHKVQTRIETFNMFVSLKEKLEMTAAFMKQSAQGRGIIFANQKNQVEEIGKFLKEKLPNLKMLILHGDLSSEDRLKNIKKFKQGTVQVLVASDVAARGIDVQDLQWVLNFNLPRNAEFYLHRCGRVGRMNNKGMVYNLITDKDAKLIALINESIKAQQGLNLDTIAKDMAQQARRKKRAAPAKKQKKVKNTKRNRVYSTRS